MLRRYEEFNNRLKGKMVASAWRVLLENKDTNKGHNMKNYARHCASLVLRELLCQCVVVVNVMTTP